MLLQPENLIKKPRNYEKRVSSYVLDTLPLCIANFQNL